MKLLTRIPFIVYPILLFSILTLPYIVNVPMLDGNIEAVQSYFIHVGGMQLNLERNSTIHPPLKMLIQALFYDLLGPKFIIFNLIGYSIGIIGILSLYSLCRSLGNTFVTKSTTLLFSIYPLFIANSLFPPNDFIITCLLLFVVRAYLKKSSLLFASTLTAITLVKETGLLALAIFIFIDLLFTFKKREKRMFYYLIPLASFFFWMIYLRINGQGEWSDHLFTETASRGTIYTIFYNLTHLKIFNPYAVSHGQQFLFLNYNWVILTISTILTIYYLLFKKNRKHFFRHITQDVQLLKTIIIMFLFSVGYYLTVLTLQTYAIPRYALPIIPFLLLWFCASLLAIKSMFLRTTVFTLVFIILIVSLVTSIDPIPTFLWGKTNVLGQSIYATNPRSAGNDGITYNMQFLFISSSRTQILKSHQKINLSTNDCFWILPNRVNDDVTISILELDNKPNVLQCKKVILY